MGFFIRRRKSGWALIQTRYQGTRCFNRVIPKSKYLDHDFKSSMSIEEARSLARRLNRKLHTHRWENKREVIRQKLKRKSYQEIEFVPAALNTVFEKELEDHPDAERLKSLWRAARRLIKTVGIPPSDWKRRCHAIYGYFERKHLSPDYAKKIVRILNLWGNFYSTVSATSYSNIKAPVGSARGRIANSYREQRARDKASDGLTVDLLKQMRESSLDEKQYNWLFISLWFGLRPKEISQISRGREFAYFDREIESGIEILNIRQTKLVHLPQEDQWKSIPILYPEQKMAAAMIRECNFEMPLPKTIKRYTSGNHHLYAGRKGFGPLMWGLGHDVVEVSSWLGHKSIDRTYRDYMSWKRVKLRTEVLSTSIH